MLSSLTFAIIIALYKEILDGDGYLLSAMRYNSADY